MANYKKSLLLIKEHLKENETIKESVFGAYENNNTTKNGIFVATETRIVFYGKKLFGFDLETFPFKNISSIEMSKGMMGHTITIFTSGNNAKMKWINNGDISKFIEYVNSNIGTSQQPDNSKLSTENDIPSQLEKLAELKTKGILTDEEFSNKKSELLAKM